MPSVCLIIRQIADALIYIHQQNWIHCAVTSHAIQLVSVDSARLTNFEYMIEKYVSTQLSAVQCLL